MMEHTYAKYLKNAWSSSQTDANEETLKSKIVTKLAIWLDLEKKSYETLVNNFERDVTHNLHNGSKTENLNDKEHLQILYYMFRFIMFTLQLRNT